MSQLWNPGEPGIRVLFEVRYGPGASLPAVPLCRAARMVALHQMRSPARNGQLRYTRHRTGGIMQLRRREMLGILGTGAIVLRNAVAADAGLRFTALDHVEFLVSDPEKSAAFYARVFGNTVLKNNKTTRRYVKIGPSYIAMDKGQVHVDHFCAGIPGFQVASVHASLDARGIAYRDFPSGKDMAV